MSLLNKNPNDVIVKRAIVHLFLGTKLPEEWVENDRLAEKEISLVFQEYIEKETKFNLNIHNTNLVALIKRFFTDIHSPPKVPQLEKQIQDCLFSNHRSPLIIYMPFNNCILIFHQREPLNNRDDTKCQIDVIQLYPAYKDFTCITTKVRLVTPISTFTVESKELLDSNFLEYLVQLRDSDVSNKFTEKEGPIGPVISWLLPSINGCKISTDEYNQYFKSINPEIMTQGGDNIWRRSPLWVGVKSLVYHLIMNYKKQSAATASATTIAVKTEGSKSKQPVTATDKNSSMVFYKTMLLGFYAKVLDKLSLDINHTEKITKIIHRIYKLKQLSDTLDRRLFNTTVKPTIDLAEKICIDINKKLQTNWEAFCEEQAKQSDITQVITQIVEGLSRPKDLKHDLQKVVDYLVDVETDNPRPASHNTSQPKLSQHEIPEVHYDEDPHFEKTLKRLKSNVTKFEKLEKFSIALYQFEMGLFKVWEHREHWKPYKILKFLKFYYEKARKRYEGDPILYSRMILICYMLVTILDILAANNGGDSPLYYQHRLFINIDVLSCLLLTTRQEYRILAEIESHLSSRLTMDKKEDIFSVGERGLANCWVRKHFSKQLEDRQNEVKVEADKRLSEFRKIKEKALKDMEKLKQDLSIASANDFEKLEKKLSDCHSVSIPYYESPLPTDITGARVVIFEELIPLPILYIRDALSYLAQICGKQEKISMFRRWPSEYKCDVILLSHSRPVKNTLGVHMYNDNDFLSLSRKSVSCYGLGLKKGIPKLSNWNNFSQHCFMKIPPKLVQSTLQPLISSTGLLDREMLERGSFEKGLNENQILASQCDTPPGMTPLEYINLGTLRCGNLLQLKNMLRYIEARNDLRSIPIYVQLNQILYEAGNRNTQPNQTRPGKEAFNDLMFVRFTCDTIERLLKTLNTEDQFCLLFVIQLLTMILNTTTIEAIEIHMKIINILLSCRAIARKWIKDLMAQRARSLMENEDSKVTDAFRLKIVYAAMAVILSFDQDPVPTDPKQDLLLAFPFSKDQQDYFEYTNGIFDLLNANLVISENTNSQRGWKRMSYEFPEQNLFDILMSHVERITYRRIGLVHSIISEFPFLLSVFILKHWDLDTNSTEDFGAWKQHDKSNFWWCRYRNDSFIQFNILEGVLLVNGSPNHRLPNDIESNEMFKSVFGTSIFEVQNIGYKRWKTATKYNHRSYEFFYTIGGNIGIQEIHENEDKFYLIPKDILENLPLSLIRDYSHWAKQDDTMEFRPNRFTEFSSDFELKYSADLDGTISQVQTNETLVNIKTTANGTLSAIINRLFKFELPEHIYVWTSMETSEVSIHLHQHKDLVFKINSAENSIDHFFYNISNNQYIGTFIGINSHLVLQEKKGNEKLVIIPHAKLTLEKVTKAEFSQYHYTSSDPNSIQSPSYFRYELDEELNILKPHEINANLFLAYTHLMTSSPFSDPFTGLSGFEMCVILLQRFQNNILFSSQSLFILDLIKRVSPSRFPRSEQNIGKSTTCDHAIEKQCLHHFQHAFYSYDILPGSICHDLIILLVNQIITTNQQCKFLYGLSDQVANPADPNTVNNKMYVMVQQDPLNLTGLWRHRRLLSNQAQPIESILPEDYGGRNEVRIVSKNPSESAIYSFRLSKFMADPTTSKNLLDLSYDIKSQLNSTTNFVGIPTDTENILMSNSVNFQTNWMSLYVIAKEVQQKKKSVTYLKLILSYLYACSDKSTPMFDHIAFLAFQKQPLPEEPTHQSYSNPSITYSPSTITQLLINNITLKGKETEDKTVSQVQSVLEQSKPYLDLWEKTTDRCPNSTSRGLTFKHASLKPSFVTQFNEQYLKWRENGKLIKFIEKVKNLYYHVYNVTPVFSGPNLIFSFEEPQRYKYDTNKANNFIDWDNNHTSVVIDDRWKTMFDQGYDEEFEEQFSECLDLRNDKYPISRDLDRLCENDKETIVGKNFYKSLGQSRDHLIQHIQDTPLYKLAHHSTIKKILGNVIVEMKESAAMIWEHIQEYYTKNWPNDLLFINTGLWKKCVPTVVYRDFINYKNQSDPGSVIPEQLFELIGIHILLTTYIQKVERCQKEASDSQIRVLSQTRTTRKWKVSDYPMWAVFELERNIWIYDIQVEIALTLIKNESNRCIQLQMGEGKSSVILPIMCLALSNSMPDRIARINVMPALFETYLQDLLLIFGSSIINRPVYIYPFKRDMGSNIAKAQVATINENLDRCFNRKGVVLCTPDHWLSFFLFRKLNTKTLKEMKDVIDWWEKHFFDILDECDELLSSKYQLIYPYGNKSPLDHGKDRWTFVQQVLEILKDTTIEVEPSEIEWTHRDRNSTFPTIIINNQDAGEKLMKVLFDKVFQIQRAFVSDRLYQRIHEFCISGAKDSFNTQGIYDKPQYLVYRSLFGYGILLHCLSKIWSKDFGTRSSYDSIILANGKRKALRGGYATLLAVPYRAKDTPAERAVLSHPDAAIVLTHLTYYQQGLTFDQFKSALVRLTSVCKHQSSDFYRSWVEYDGNIPEQFRDVGCIVISNLSLIKELYGFFKLNIKVINFWLDQLVLPFETQQYPTKVYATSWDIASGKNKCGFSGTNDTACLFPLSIQQKDLETLLYTNTQVFNYILTQSIDKPLTLIPQGGDILDTIVKMKKFARVFIDAGALMIGMTNQQVAKTFLAKTNMKRADAVLYFENDNLISMDRDGKKLLFHQSPYANRLNRVVVYLDDYHTRGVDIKFEKDTHAIVTIGARMTKDKLLQSCMRLRKLGHGQTVSFIAPEHLNAGDNIIEIFHWTISNTIDLIEKSLFGWVNQGLQYYRSMCALKLEGEGLENAFLKLSSLPEVSNLSEMYQSAFTEQELIVVANNAKTSMINKFKADTEKAVPQNRELANRLIAEHERSIREITKRIKELGKNIYIFSTNEDEEQERENELEEEREDLRNILRRTAAPHHFDNFLLSLVTGTSPIKTEGLHFDDSDESDSDDSDSDDSSSSDEDDNSLVNLMKRLDDRIAKMKNKTNEQNTNSNNNNINNNNNNNNKDDEEEIEEEEEEVVKEKEPEVITLKLRKPLLAVERIYTNTPIRNILQIKSEKLIKLFDSRIMVTHDFVKVVESQSAKCEDYCRIPNYVLVLWNNGVEPSLVLVSQYEANRLLGAIQKTPKENCTVSLHQTLQHSSPKQIEYFYQVHTPLPENADTESIKPLLIQLNILNGSKFFDSTLTETCKFLGIRYPIEPIVVKSDENDKKVTIKEQKKRAKESEVDADGFIKQEKYRFGKNPMDFLKKNFVINRVTSLNFSDIEKVLPHINK